MERLTTALRAERALPQGVIDFITAAPKSSAPIDVMRTAVSMLGCYPTVRHDLAMSERQATAIKLISQIGIVAAYFHRARTGRPLPPIRKDLSEAAHFLWLLTGEEPSPEAVETLDVAYVLHAAELIGNRLLMLIGNRFSADRKSLFGPPGRWPGD